MTAVDPPNIGTDKTQSGMLPAAAACYRMPDPANHFNNVACYGWDAGRTMTVNGVSITCSSNTTKMTYPHARADGYNYFEVGAGSAANGDFDFYCDLGSCL
jgi:hypothetical protein